LISELRDVLERPKFASRLSRARVSVDRLVLGYGSLARIVGVAPVEPVVLDDPDDDAVIACAVASRARHIVSGDHHLLDVGRFRDCLIRTPADFLAELGNEEFRTRSPTR
jgi:hypothetical protein